MSSCQLKNWSTACFRHERQICTLKNNSDALFTSICKCWKNTTIFSGGTFRRNDFLQIAAEEKGGRIRLLFVKTIASKERAVIWTLYPVGTCIAQSSSRNPYRRISGGRCGIGLGSFVTCRHHLSAPCARFGQLAYSHVPGVSSRAILSSENTAPLLFIF